MCGVVSSHSEQRVKDDVAWKAWAASDELVKKLLRNNIFIHYCLNDDWLVQV